MSAPLDDALPSTLSNQVVANTRDLRKVAAAASQASAPAPLPPLPPMIDTSLSMHTLYTPQLLSYDSAKQTLTKPPSAISTSPPANKPTLLSILKSESPPTTEPSASQKKSGRRSVGFGAESVRTFARGSLVHEHQTSPSTELPKDNCDEEAPAAVISMGQYHSNGNSVTNGDRAAPAAPSHVAAESERRPSNSMHAVQLQPLRGHNHLPDSTDESLSSHLASLALEESPEEAEARADAEAAAAWKPTTWGDDNGTGGVGLNRDRSVRSYAPKKHNPFVAWSDAPATYVADAVTKAKVQEARLAKPAPFPTPDEKPSASTGTYKRPILRKPRVPAKRQDSTEQDTSPETVSQPVSPKRSPTSAKTSASSTVMQSRVTERPAAAPAPVVATSAASSIEGYNAVPSDDKLIWQEIFGTPFPTDAAEFATEEADDLIESNAILKKNCFTNMWMCLEDMMPVPVVAWLNNRDVGPPEVGIPSTSNDNDEETPQAIEQSRQSFNVAELQQRQNIVRLLSRALIAVENVIKLEEHIGTTATEYHHTKNTLMSKLNYSVNPTFSTLQWHFFALLIIDAILRHRIHGPLNISNSAWNEKFYEYAYGILKNRTDLLGEREIILLRTYFNFDSDDDFVE